MFIANRVKRRKIARQLEAEEAYQHASASVPQTYAGFAAPSAGEAATQEQ